MRRGILAMWRVFLLIFLLPMASHAQQGLSGGVIPNLLAPTGTNSDLLSVTVTRGLKSSKRLRTRALRRARAAMHANEPVSTANLRSLAEVGDGLAAQRYVRRLLEEDEATASDLAFFSAVAVGTGRIWTLDTMIEAMHQLDPATEPRSRVHKYIGVLYPHAWAGNAKALEAVVVFNGEGKLFGPLVASSRLRILKEARSQSDGRIALGMAMVLLEQVRNNDTADPKDLEEARGLLEHAKTSDQIDVHTTADNLLRLIDTPTVQIQDKNFQ